MGCALTLQYFLGKKVVVHIVTMHLLGSFATTIKRGRLLAMGEASCAVVRTGSCDVVCRMMRPVPEER